jgi:hypothetical protein
VGKPKSSKSDDEIKRYVKLLAVFDWMPPVVVVVMVVVIIIVVVVVITVVITVVVTVVVVVIVILLLLFYIVLVACWILHLGGAAAGLSLFVLVDQNKKTARDPHTAPATCDKILYIILSCRPSCSHKILSRVVTIKNIVLRYIVIIRVRKVRCIVQYLLAVITIKNTMIVPQAWIIYGT